MGRAGGEGVRAKRRRRRAGGARRAQVRFETSPRADAPTRVPWGAAPDSSPEGWAEDIIGAVTRLHWHVFTMASPAALTLAGAALAPALAAAAGAAPVRALAPALAAAAGAAPAPDLAPAPAPAPAPAAPPLVLRGFLHAEKNWGAAFPDAYVWAQGVSEDGQARAGPRRRRAAAAAVAARARVEHAPRPPPQTSFALAGGPLPNVGAPVMMLSVHSPRLAGGGATLDATHPGVPLALAPDHCGGRLNARLQGLGLAFEVDVAAPPRAFARIPCPTAAAGWQARARGRGRAVV